MKNGLVVYAKNDYSKCNLSSNCVYSNTSVEFCIADLSTMVKIFTTVKDMYRDIRFCKDFLRKAIFKN